jgi:hypothetical protein
MDPGALDLLGTKNLILNLLARNLDDTGRSFSKKLLSVTQESPAGTGQ